MEAPWGYVRTRRRPGLRNDVIVLAAMDNVNGIVEKVCHQIRAARPLLTWYGRGQYGQDAVQMTRTFQGLITNPNAGAVVVVSLEPVSTRPLVEALQAADVPHAVVSVQEAGGSLEAVKLATEATADLLWTISRERRQPIAWSDVVLGVECGGSDTTSGLAANPVVGQVADRLIDVGGTVVLSETSEILGAEHLLAARARTPQVAAAIRQIVAHVEEEAQRRGVDIRGANPVPDNIRGGITTIEEKSLGAIAKGGTRPVEGVLQFAEAVPTGGGLYVMDTPAPAAESMTGLAAGGVQIILFTTGQGNIIGSPIAPTIKVTANPMTARKMRFNIDLDISATLTEGWPLEEAAHRVWQTLLDVASGTLTRAEILGETAWALHRIEPTV